MDLPKELSEVGYKRQGVAIRPHLSNQCRVINVAPPCLMFRSSEAVRLSFLSALDNVCDLKVELEPSIKQVIELSVSNHIRPLPSTIIALIIGDIIPWPGVIAGNIMFLRNAARITKSLR